MYYPLSHPISSILCCRGSAGHRNKILTLSNETWIPKWQKRDYIQRSNYTDQCVVEEEQLSSDHSEVGKQSSKWSQSVQSVEKEIAADFTQMWKRDCVEVAGFGVLNKNDGKVALDHRAITQHSQVVHVACNPRWTAHCTAIRHLAKEAFKK